MEQHLEVLQAELGRILNGLDESQTQLRPLNQEAKWSIQQIVGHLRLTYVATIEAIDARIARQSPTRAKPSLGQYAAQFTVLRLGYFPRGRTAPERVVAPADLSARTGRELFEEVSASLATLGQRLETAAGVFGSDRRAISHMVLGPLSIGQWRRFHLVHGRHHIEQIIAIRRQRGV